MSHVTTKALPPGQYLRLSQIDWHTYTRLLRAFAERPAIRLTYDSGELEIMSPLLEHDYDGRFLGDLVVALTEELHLPRMRGGSTTLRRKKRRKGIEADDCFWIANAHRMAGRRRLALRTDPPPDLAIEVDVTHSTLDHLRIYASLQVPEVWRLNGDLLTFHVLADGAYHIAATSRAFPMLTPADLLVFVQAARQTGDENEVMRRFREWMTVRPEDLPSRTREVSRARCPLGGPV